MASIYRVRDDFDRKIERELKHDPKAVQRNWLRRILCAVCCRKRQGFSACLTRCLADGHCCQKGHENCAAVE